MADVLDQLKRNLEIISRYYYFYGNYIYDGYMDYWKIILDYDNWGIEILQVL